MTLAANSQVFIFLVSDPESKEGGTNILHFSSFSFKMLFSFINSLICLFIRVSDEIQSLTSLKSEFMEVTLLSNSILDLLLLKSL